eukprot:CAMPEP_0183588004 /NCGR_PEP_ID=MMETSP0371-20130417/160041_1 /TAXON_ID=268820 /ORGANISM="Peridinium aciculiferum, Strain PAER-2" /LENGTH=263 /DNA_ID=CAMNT_0025799235 /DNA_START=96 /DNA_END=884 /DNA_ORIENTATION=+
MTRQAASATHIEDDPLKSFASVQRHAVLAEEPPAAAAATACFAEGSTAEPFLTGRGSAAENNDRRQSASDATEPTAKIQIPMATMPMTMGQKATKTVARIAEAKGPAAGFGFRTPLQTCQTKCSGVRRKWPVLLVAVHPSASALLAVLNNVGKSGTTVPPAMPLLWQRVDDNPAAAKTVHSKTVSMMELINCSGTKDVTSKVAMPSWSRESPTDCVLHQCSLSVQSTSESLGESGNPVEHVEVGDGGACSLKRTAASFSACMV